MTIEYYRIRHRSHAYSFKTDHSHGYQARTKGQDDLACWICRTKRSPAGSAPADSMVLPPRLASLGMEGRAIVELHFRAWRQLHIHTPHDSWLLLGISTRSLKSLEYSISMYASSHETAPAKKQTDLLKPSHHSPALTAPYAELLQTR